MTIGSPSRFFSISSGRVIGSRPGSAGVWTGEGWLDMGAESSLTLVDALVAGSDGPLAQQRRHLVVDCDDAVRLGLDVDDPRLVSFEVGLFVARLGDHDDRVPVVDQASG